MGKKITNELIEQRLLIKNIKRIGNYMGPRSKVEIECLVDDCNYKWSVRIDYVNDPRLRCPKCAGSKLDNSIVDNRLEDRNIKRLGDFINSHTKIPFECLICNYEWKTSPTHLINDTEGCPQCAGVVPLTNLITDNRLLQKNINIKRIGDIINSKIKTLFQCLKCDYEWSARPNNILNNETSCPQCAGLIRLTNSIIDNRLEENNRKIKRIGNCVNKETKIEWGCLIENCNYAWFATPGHILNAETGCPKCSFGKNEKIAHNILLTTNFIIKSQKYLKDINIEEKRRFRVDFFLPQLNTIIEYNGHQHYRSVRFNGISQERANENFLKQQERDTYLTQFCQQNNIDLIWIDGRKYTNSKLTDYLNNIIIPQLKAKEIKNELH